MLLQERVNVRKVPDIPGKTIQLIDYQDIAEAAPFIKDSIRCRSGRDVFAPVKSSSENCCQESTWPENFDSQYSRFIRN